MRAPPPSAQARTHEGAPFRQQPLVRSSSAQPATPGSPVRRAECVGAIIVLGAFRAADPTDAGARRHADAEGVPRGFSQGSSRSTVPGSRAGLRLSQTSGYQYACTAQHSVSTPPGVRVVLWCEQRLPKRSWKEARFIMPERSLPRTSRPVWRNPMAMKLPGKQQPADGSRTNSQQRGPKRPVVVVDPGNRSAEA